jgi:uncharacterized protein YjdB
MSRRPSILLALVVAAACSGESGPTPPEGVGRIDVSPATATVVQGTTQSLSAVVRDAGGNVIPGRTVTWSSSTPTIASVSGTGVVTGVNPGGPTTITASSEGLSGSATITVTAPVVASLDLDPSSVTLTVGATRQIMATPRNAAGEAVPVNVTTWSTNNDRVATVTSSGLVRAVGAGGPVTITAFAGNVSKSATVTVTP